MERIVEELKASLDGNTSLPCDFVDLSRIYCLTTENIRGYLSKFDLNDKSVLTVAGSGDQMLNSYLLGAKNVTCFDINRLTYCQLQLKKAAIETLSYDEYIEYYISKSGSFFDYDLFRKIDSVLKENDPISSQLFNYLYSKYTPSEIFNKICYKWRPTLKKMKYMNNYFNQYYYSQLSKTIHNKAIDFINCDVSSLKNSIGDTKFDIIILSNICEYIEKMYSSDSLIKFKELIMSLSSNLNDNGIIQCGYIYDHYIEKPIYADKKERNKVFFENDFSSFKVLAFDADERFPDYKNKRDTVVVYKKK